jgi:hypothetical protein
MSSRMRISQDISSFVQQPYVVPSGIRSQVSPSEIRLKGLLETLRPPNKDIPISSYSYVTYKILNAMNMDSSEELLKETVDETVEEDTEY